MWNMLAAGISTLFFVALSLTNRLPLVEPEPTTGCFLVSFTDKEAQNFDPTTYFHPQALERRKNLGLPLYDERDLPLNERYVEAVAHVVDSLRYRLRWFNAVSVQASPAQLLQLSQLPFVDSIRPLGHYVHARPASTNKARPSLANPKLDTLLSLSRGLMQLDSLEAHGLWGRGIRIAIFDAGFKEADTHPALAYARSKGHILQTRNFYQPGASVYAHSTHGTEVMSCIAGMMEGRQLGCAKEAEFLLARTEHEKKELPAEEDHWLAAAQWADQQGAHIINSSITFTHERYTYEDMDGKTSMVSRAAAIATQKGILVVCAMGNEGEKAWKYMGAPADAPEVLSVGGSMPMLPMHIKFASIGPNSAGKLKPDVAAPAYVVTAWKKGRFDINAGTSFASPLVAGLAACMLQQDSSLRPAALSAGIRSLGHYYPYFDYYLGYGVPQAGKLFRDSLPLPSPTFSVDFRADSVILHFDPQLMARDTLQHPNGRVLYYHLQQPDSSLSACYFDLIPNSTRHYFFLRKTTSSGMLRIWFEGYLYEHELEVMQEGK